MHCCVHFTEHYICASAALPSTHTKAAYLAAGAQIAAPTPAMSTTCLHRLILLSAHTLLVHGWPAFPGQPGGIPLSKLVPVWLRLAA